MSRSAFLRDCWERALAVDPVWLAWAREYVAADEARLMAEARASLGGAPQ